MINDVATSPYNTLPEVIKDIELPDNIVIYDSTLRDGEQMPGVSFSPEQKLSVAKKLDEDYHKPKSYFNHCSGKNVIDQLRETFGNEIIGDCLIGAKFEFEY